MHLKIIEATYGQIRPSVSFVSEARVIRPVKDTDPTCFLQSVVSCGHFLRGSGEECNSMDMSILPHPLMDPKGDPREGTFEIPPPPKEVDDSFIKMCAQQFHVLPSRPFILPCFWEVSKPQLDASIRAIQGASPDESRGAEVARGEGRSFPIPQAHDGAGAQASRGAHLKCI